VCCKKANRFRRRDLSSAAAALCATGSAGEAAAAIQTGLGPFIVGDSFTIDGSPAIFSSITIDAMNGTGGELFLEATMGAMGSMVDSTIEFVTHAYSGGDAMDQADYLDLFLDDSGDTVHSLLAYTGGKSYLTFHSYQDPGHWKVLDSEYIGFRFDADGVDVGNDWLYGWLQLDFSSSQTLQVIEWAYEDVAGNQITVGDTGLQTPEPSTALLVGLGLAGIGLGSRFLRRQSRRCDRT
jgi:hypothetical protein